MMSVAFADELTRFGPQADNPPCVSVAEARSYCRKLARSHYENFTVASHLLPRRLRQHFYHVYAYCRWSDDLADETGDPELSRELLDWWQEEVQRCYAGEATHPVFVALSDTIEQFKLPQEPFLDLLKAFRQDQSVTRYDSPQEVLEYCRYSANPVGQLVLGLAGVREQKSRQLADCICTGLQLTNFCQDVANDWDRGRVYLPRETLDRSGYDESQFAGRTANKAFRRVMAEEVDRAEMWLRKGLPLADRVPRWLRVDVELFARGGLELLDRIRKVDYDVWSKRPELSKLDQLKLLTRCWLNSFSRPRAAGPA